MNNLPEVVLEAEPPKEKAAGATTDVLALLKAGTTDVFVLPNVKAGATTFSVAGTVVDNGVGVIAGGDPNLNGADMIPAEL